MPDHVELPPNSPDNPFSVPIIVEREGGKRTTESIQEIEKEQREKERKPHIFTKFIDAEMNRDVCPRCEQSYPDKTQIERMVHILVCHPWTGSGSFSYWSILFFVESGSKEPDNMNPYELELMKHISERYPANIYQPYRPEGLSKLTAFEG